MTNYDTVDEVKNNIEKMVSRKALNSMFEGEYEDRINMRFTEFKGTLYQVSCDRTYDEMKYDENSIEYVGRRDSTYYVSIDAYYFEEFYCTEQLEFKKIDGNWVVTNMQKTTDPYAE